ncbi:MAG: histidine kinase [Bacteroidales bacterium]
MSKKRIIYIHIFIWLFALFANIPYFTLDRRMAPEHIVSDIIGFLYLMVVFYLFYLVLVPAFLNRKKIIEFFSFSFLLVLIMPFFGYTLLFLSRAIFEGSFNDFYKGYTLRMHMSGYYPVLTAAVFGSFFSVIINWFTTMNQKAELDKQKISIEHDLLKSKLNPHFLFNTLNNIDSLIHTDPDKASEALIRLSEMMRYLTYETSSDLVELKKEVEYLTNLVDLHRLRTRSPEDIEFRTTGNMSVKIAPALFIPLVENSFKFAVYNDRRPGVAISLSASDGIIKFEISNSFRKTEEAGSNHLSGSGMINLKKRLDLTYPGRYNLIAVHENSRYIVNLTIDTNDR